MAGLQDMLLQQMDEVSLIYDGISLTVGPDGSYAIVGKIGFEMSYAGMFAAGEYEVEILIPPNFPTDPPMALETLGQIPRAFHHLSEFVFCLGLPIEIRMKFAEQPTLLGFIQRLLVPYLFSYQCLKQHGAVPYGEAGHNPNGMMAFYDRHLSTSADRTLRLVKLLADDRLPPLAACPCGSGQNLQDCHQSRLEGLRIHQTPREFASDLNYMINNLKLDTGRLEHDALRPERTLRRRRSRSKKLAKRRKKD